MKGWRDANERMIGGCSLYSAKRSDSNKRMKSCGHKCQHQAPLKGTQSSYLADTRHGLRRNFHQLAKCSWTKVPTLPRHQ
ncbi:hypothetical protein AAG906_019045 [Vitis piasezkii]